MNRRIVIMWSVVTVVVAGGVAGVVLATREPFHVTDYAAMCAKPRPFEQAARRGTTGPHPVFLAADWVRPQPGEEAVWEPTDPATVQLVACSVTKGKGDLIKSCRYAVSGDLFDEGDVDGIPEFTSDLYRGLYRLDLYEARTGALVASKDIDGDWFIGNSPDSDEPCQDYLQVSDDSKPRAQLVGRPSSATLRTVLEEHVLR